MVNLRQHTHSPHDIVELTEHKKKSFKQGTMLALFCVLYVDDGVFTFRDCDQLKRGLTLIYHHFTRFGLEMHVGKGKIASKTECVFLLPPLLFLAERLNFCPKHHGGGKKTHSGLEAFFPLPTCILRPNLVKWW